VQPSKWSAWSVVTGQSLPSQSLPRSA